MAANVQEFFADGDFTVPAGVTQVRVTMVGGGAGGWGASTNANPAGGRPGASGEFVIDFPISVTPAEVIPVTIGLGSAGTGTQSIATAPVAGGNTSFGTYAQVLGAPSGAAVAGGGFGGGAAGGAVNPGVPGTPGTIETPAHFGGGGQASNGRADPGPGGSGTGTAGISVGAAGGVVAGGNGGGGAGSSSLWGVGGAGGDGATDGHDAPLTSYGAGGGGAGGGSPYAQWGGFGADGYCMVTWLGPFITPPAPPTPTDPDYADTVQLAHLDGTNGSTTIDNDAAGGTTLVALGTAALSTTQKKFGSASLYMSGSGTNGIAQTTDDTAYTFGVDPFTLEFWYRPDASGANSLLFMISNGVNYGIYSWGGQLRYYSSGDKIYGPAMIANTWYFISYSRPSASGTGYLHVNGNPVGNWSDTTDYSSGKLYIGRDANAAAYPTAGYFDDVRITKGVGRYGSGKYRVPVVAFPNS